MKPDQTYPETAVELFALRDGAGTILYAPLGQLMARVNESAASCALAYAADHAARDGMTEDERAVVDELAAHGFFDERPLPHSEEEFCPLQATLFPTNRCNLRCSYCYAFGGEGGASGEPLVTMSPDVAQARHRPGCAQRAGARCRRCALPQLPRVDSRQWRAVLRIRPHARNRGMGRIFPSGLTFPWCSTRRRTAC